MKTSLLAYTAFAHAQKATAKRPQPKNRPIVGAEGVESAQLKSVKITNIADKRILIGISFGKIETIKINNNHNVALKLRQKAI